MYQTIVRELAFHFDRESEMIVFQGTMQDGSGFQVAFPISHVSTVFDQHAQAMGYANVAIMGDVATIDGFFGKITHAIGHGMRSVYDHTIRTVGTHAAHYGRAGLHFVGHEGQALARSKTFGTVLGGVAVCFPAVGAPALAAWGAAHTAMAMKDAHDRGHRTNYPQLQANYQVLANTDSPEARMSVAALASVPPDPGLTLQQAEDIIAQLQASFSLGAAYIAPPTGQTSTRPAPPSARPYIAPPTGQTSTRPAPPSARPYIAPPPPQGARPYIAPPTGQIFRPAPPTGHDFPVQLRRLAMLVLTLRLSIGNIRIPGSVPTLRRPLRSPWLRHTLPRGSGRTSSMGNTIRSIARNGGRNIVMCRL